MRWWVLGWDVFRGIGRRHVVRPVRAMFSQRPSQHITGSDPFLRGEV
jgi:hypothetical protein